MIGADAIPRMFFLFCMLFAVPMEQELNPSSHRVTKDIQGLSNTNTIL